MESPKNSINIEIAPTAAPASVEVYDLTGREVISSQPDLSGGQASIDASSLSDGVYIVSLSAGTVQQSRKVVLTKN